MLLVSVNSNTILYYYGVIVDRFGIQHDNNQNLISLIQALSFKMYLYSACIVANVGLVFYSMLVSIKAMSS